jgi:hypothetical protein
LVSERVAECERRAVRRMWLEFWEGAWRASEHGQARSFVSHRALTLPARSPNGIAVIMHTLKDIFALNPLSSRQPGTQQSSRLEDALHVSLSQSRAPLPARMMAPLNLNLRPQQKSRSDEGIRAKKVVERATTASYWSKAKHKPGCIVQRTAARIDYCAYIICARAPPLCLRHFQYPDKHGNEKKCSCAL